MISRIRRFGSAPTVATMFVALWLAGCATQETASENDQATEAAAPEAVAEATGGGGRMPEVLFTNIEDGGTYDTPVEVIFGTHTFNIVPVEDPPVVRPGEGHYHLAIDADCVAAGQIIPPGTPSYVHFGDGSDRITVQFPVGEHRLCLQIADGEHRVFDGPDHSMLTKEVRITVTTR